MSGLAPDKQISANASSLFERLFESSPDAIVVANRDGQVTLANNCVEKMFGYRRDELLGQPIEILVPERFRPAHPTHRISYAAQPQARPMGTGMDLYGRRKDGTEFPVDIMLTPLQTEPELLMVAVIRDVTNRKTSQGALFQSEQRFRLLVESAKEYAIFMLDPTAGWPAGTPGRSGSKDIVPRKLSASISRAFTRRKTSNGQA